MSLHAGLLVNKPLGPAELHFNQSSDFVYLEGGWKSQPPTLIILVCKRGKDNILKMRTAITAPEAAPRTAADARTAPPGPSAP